MADGQRTLLPVEHLEAVHLVSHPIHDIQRKPLSHCLYNRVALCGLVDELALICRADVQPAVIASNAQLRRINIPIEHLADRYLVFLDFHLVVHLSFPFCLRRMSMRRNFVLPFMMLMSLEIVCPSW